jgi:hypothetical protein
LVDVFAVVVGEALGELAAAAVGKAAALNAGEGRAVGTSGAGVPGATLIACGGASLAFVSSRLPPTTRARPIAIPTSVPAPMIQSPTGRRAGGRATSLPVMLGETVSVPPDVGA